MSNSLLLLIVLSFALLNFLTGLVAAAFFGRGPLRSNGTVRFLSDPSLPVPALVLRIARRCGLAGPTPFAAASQGAAEAHGDEPSL